MEQQQSLVLGNDNQDQFNFGWAVTMKALILSLCLLCGCVWPGIDNRRQGPFDHRDFSHGPFTNATLSYPGNIWIRPTGNGFMVVNSPPHGHETVLLIAEGTTLTLNGGTVIAGDLVVTGTVTNQMK
jgi:hypothetical protein